MPEYLVLRFPLIYSDELAFRLATDLIFKFGRLHPSLKIFSQKLFKFILVSRKALISRYAAEHLAV